MTHPPQWSDEQLISGILRAKDLFREERLQEPLESYTKAFDNYRGTVSDLLESSTNLSRLNQTLTGILTSPQMLEAFRYLAGPPISEDDLMVLADARLSPSRLREDAPMAARVLKVVQTALDSRRFPWVVEDRQPTPAEKNAAIVASAALMAASRVGTDRRNEGKERQELTVRDALLSRKWNQVQPRSVATFNQAPNPGEFCRESLLGSSKADFLIGLRDRRIMAIECKVSNSSTNSVKRLNREAAGKAEKWIYEFGVRNVVPVAILSGVYKLHNIKSAQDRGLIIYWAHDLNQLLDWIDASA
jgi:hypothetical protein